jgi:phosphoribosylformylglycinamidine synthase I
MKVGVVVFPGSNCDDDLVYALQNGMGLEVVKLWHKQTSLEDCSLIMVPGGFSYGDYLRSGAIARFSPIMNEVIRHAGRGGFVMGICNGFQILTEAGLLPGTLLHNSSQKFICKNAYIRPISHTAPLTAGLDHGRTYKIPVAHGEGRYYASEQVLDELEANDQVLFKYTDADGIWHTELHHESNFNGSERNIAGVSNRAKNVFGMMPHPERAADPILGNTDGLALFQSLFELAEV